MAANHTLVTLRFGNTELERLTGFNRQNALNDLKITRNGEQKRRFTVDMPANNGCDATFTCETIDVVWVEPYTAEQRLRDGSVYAESDDKEQSGPPASSGDGGANHWYGFWIGQQPTLCLWVTYLRPEGPFHNFRAEAAVPGFKALFDFTARLEELSSFRAELKQMYETLQGTVSFRSIESNVVVDGTIDHRGHVFWEVSLKPNLAGDYFTELRFRIEEDQTSLWNVAAKIGDMLDWLSEQGHMAHP